MNIAEILRGLADKIDGIGNEVPHQDQSAQLHPAQATNNEHPDVNTDSMVSPLQQKLELIKKVAGVDSAFATGKLDTDVDNSGCADCGCTPCECEHESDEDTLATMKHLAGIAPAAATLIVADEDEPFEG
jgi:hypothetical protein